MKRQYVETPKRQSGEQRKRPWLRRIATVVVCLLAGAFINVLVAWSCAAFADPTSAPVVMSVRAGGNEHWRVVRFSRPGVTVVFSRLSRGRIPFEEVEEGIFPSKLFPPGIAPQRIPADLEPKVDLTGMANRDVFAYGWPLNSLWWDRYVQLSTEWKGIVEANKASIDIGLKRWHYSAPRNLPYCPLWPAFAINTLIYTAPILVILFCVQFARRTRPGFS